MATRRPLPLMVPWLEPQTCHLWWAQPSRIDIEIGLLLDANERDRLTQLRYQADRDRFAAACSVIRLALGTYLGQPPAEIAIVRACPTCNKPHGKPRLGEPSSPLIELSVAHSGDRVAVAFALNTPLGVDVETVWSESRPSIEDLAKQVLTAEEAARLKAINREEWIYGFLRYWTRKEAVVKATGQGLTIPMRHLSVSAPDEPPELTAWSPELELARPVTLYDPDAGPDYVSSLAVIGTCDDLLVLDGSDLLVRHRYARWRGA